MEELIALVAIVLGLSIPLSVILGVYRFKSKKLKLQQFSTEERQVLLELKSENGELKRRLEELEGKMGLRHAHQEQLKLEETQEPDIAAKLEKLAQQRLKQL